MTACVRINYLHHASPPALLHHRSRTHHTNSRMRYGRLLLFLLLLGQQSMCMVVEPVFLEIGLLFPFVPLNGTNLTITHLESFSAIIGATLAVQHIRSNTTNSILPITSILHDYISIDLHLNDTTSESSGALDAAVYQGRQSNMLASIIGVYSSNQCVPASSAAATLGLPLMSMSCTTPVLSDKLVHPTFMRVVPSDEGQGALLANLILLFGWKRICIVQTNEVYGVSIAKSLQASLHQTADDLNIPAVEVTLVNTISLDDPSTLNQQLNQTLFDLSISGRRIVILCMTRGSTELLTMAGSTYNMLTAEWVWIGSDSVMIELQSPSNSNLLNSLTGVIGVVPLVDTTAAPYQRFVDVWQQQNVSDYLSLLPDLPSDIFSHPPAYFQASLSYDIILAYGLAAKGVIDSGQSVTRQSILARLRQSDFLFDGITRTNISFDSNGNAAPAYSVMNLQTINSTVSINTLSLVHMNGSSGAQLMNTPVGQQILSLVQFHSGSSLIPSDHDSHQVTTIDFLITGLMSESHLPVDSRGATCTFLFTNFTLTNSTTAPITKNCTGGFSRRLAYFQSIRANSTNVIAVDLGQSYHPSPYFTVDQGLTIARWMSEMQFDVLTLLADDFSLGASGLVRYLHLLQPPCLTSDVGTPVQTSGACAVATTLVFPTGSMLSTALLLPYVIKLVDGVKVGFITLEPIDLAVLTDSSGEFTMATDQTLQLQSTIDHLHQIACHIIILIATASIPPTTLNQVVSHSNGINMVWGHWSDTESLLDSWTLLDLHGDVVQLVRIDYDTSDVVHLTATFDNLSGEALIAQTLVRPIKLGNGSPEVLTLELEEADMLIRTNQKLNQPITDAPIDIAYQTGLLTTSLDNSTGPMIPVGVDGCRVTQCPIGSLLADIMLTFCSSCSIAHINSGSLRDSIHAGPISLANVLSVLPFADKFATYEMKGSDILLVLQHSISKAGLGGYQQWSGIRFAYTIDHTIQASSFADRIVLTFTEVMIDGAYQPIQSCLTYKLVTYAFTVGGGDGFSMIPTLGRNIRQYADVLVDWTVSWLQSGQLKNYQISTRQQLQPCWNQTYTLAQNPSDSSTLLWPRTSCRIIASSGDIVMLCPALQTVVTTTRIDTNSSSNNLTTTISSCQCISNYERSSLPTHPCQHCADNFVKSYPGDHPCVCDSTHYYLPTFLQGQPFQCVDPTGYSEYPPAADTGGPCKVCPPCMDCLQWDEFSANLTNYAPTPESFDQWSAAWSISPGWWWDGRSNIIYKCPTLSSRPDATNGCKGTETNVLPCHLGSTGPLCLQCISGYSATSHHRCAECPSYGQSVALFILSLIGVILFIVFVVYSSFLPKSQSSTTNKILVRHLQTAAFIGAFRISDGDIIRVFTSAVGITNNAGAKALSYHCVFEWNIIDLMRISSVLLLILWLVTITAMISREIRKRRNPTNDDGKIFKVVEAKSFLCGCCSRSNTQQNDSADGPQKPQIKIWSWEQVCLPVCTVIILFLYPSLVLESVRFLVPCLELNGESLMANDTSISCHSSDYIQTWWIALLRLLFIGFGTPIIMLVRLRAYRGSLLRSNDTRNRESHSFFLRYRFLIEGYTDAAWFWEVVNMSRHVAFVLCVAYLTQDDASQPYVGIWVLTVALLLNMFYHPFRTVQVNESIVKERQTPWIENASELKDTHPRDVSESHGHPNGHTKDQVSAAPKFDHKRSIVSEMRQNLSAVHVPQPSLNLNHLESVSIVILITTIIFIALSHADVVRGSSSSTSSINSVTTTNSAVKGYGVQQSYDDDSIMTTSSTSSDTMSGYAITLLVLVVIMHLCFILFIFFFGFPHLRSWEYWRSQSKVLIQLIRTASNKQKSTPLDLTVTPNLRPVIKPLPSPSLTDFVSPDQFHQPTQMTESEPHETNSTTLPTIHVHMPPTLISSPSSTSSRPRPTHDHIRFSSQSLSNLFKTPGEEDSNTSPNELNQVHINHPSLHVINHTSTSTDLADPPVKSERDSSSAPPPILTSNGTISTPSRLATRLGFHCTRSSAPSSTTIYMNPSPVPTTPPTPAPELGGVNVTTVPRTTSPLPPTSKLFPSISSLLAHQRSQTTHRTQTDSNQVATLAPTPSSLIPPPLPQYPIHEFDGSKPNHHSVKVHLNGN